MSRLGKSPVAIPKGVEVKVADGLIRVKGAKGELTQLLMDGITIRVEEGQVLVEKSDKTPSCFHGLYRALINNMVIGVTSGFEKRLQLVGVGFRASASGTAVDLLVGFSHPTQLKIPEGVAVKVEKNTEIIVSGMDKQKVGQFAATIRAKRPPEPYKGKGIRYKDEYVRKKAGKAKGK